MKKKSNIKLLLLITIITIILLFQLFYNKRLYGHDTLFHTGSIIYLSKTISIANPLGDKIIKLDTNPFGYGTWLFYPKLPHLLGSYLYLICKNIYLSMNIIYLITFFLSGVIMFFLSKKLFHNNKVAFLSSVIYLTYSYHICEIYIRDAYAENFMFMVIPLIFLGLYELKDNNTKKFYIYFILGYVIGMYSHLISMFYCTIFVFLFLIYYRKIFLQKDKLKKLLISTIIVTNLTLPFLTTILEHRLLGNYVVFTENFSNKDSVMNNIISIDKYFNHRKDAIYDNIIIYINYITMLLIIVTTIIFLLKKYRNKYKVERRLLVFASLICIALINSPWLWKHLPNIFSMIQFPWRITILLSIVISLYAPLCFLNQYKYIDKKIITTIYIIAIILTTVDGINNIFYYGKIEYSQAIIKNSKEIMGWQQEYSPSSKITYEEKLKFNTNTFKPNYQIDQNNNTNIIILEDKFPSLKFKVAKIKKDTNIILPRTYYLGYQLTCNNKKYKLKEAENGLLKAKINKNGIYTLKYTGTIYDKISRIICIITIIIIGVTIYGKERNSRFKSLVIAFEKK